MTTFPCRDVSAAITDDNYFQLMMWSAWPLKSRLPSEVAAGGSRGIVPITYRSPATMEAPSEPVTPAGFVEALT